MVFKIKYRMELFETLYCKMFSSLKPQKVMRKYRRNKTYHSKSFDLKGARIELSMDSKWARIGLEINTKLIQNRFKMNSN